MVSGRQTRHTVAAQDCRLRGSRQPRPAVVGSRWKDARVRAWVNGQLLDDPTGPAVAVSDHGLTVGDGVFEAVKAIKRRPFALGRHLERLSSSAEGLGLPVP